MSCTKIHYRIVYDFCTDKKTWQGMTSKYDPVTDLTEHCYFTQPYFTFIEASEELWKWMSADPEFSSALLAGMHKPRHLDS